MRKIRIRSQIMFPKITRCLINNGSPVTLYAMWKSVPAGKYMQDFHTMSPEQKTQFINNMTLNQQYEMIDKRDGKTYYVAKLADGNVWMTEDLDFDLSTGKTLTPEDTDIPSNWTPTVSTQKRPYSWSASQRTPQSVDLGDYCWTGTTFSCSAPGGSSTRSCEQHDASHFHLGNSYNFPAAVAMNDVSSYNSNGYDMNQSICPAGWRLPPYSGDKSFYNLKNRTNFNVSSSGSNLAHLSPWYMTWNGYYDGSDNSNIGCRMHTRTSSVYNSDSSYHLEENATQDYHGKYAFGFAVRCVVR